MSFIRPLLRRTNQTQNRFMSNLNTPQNEKPSKIAIFLTCYFGVGAGIFFYRSPQIAFKKCKDDINYYGENYENCSGALGHGIVEGLMEGLTWGFILPAMILRHYTVKQLNK